MVKSALVQTREGGTQCFETGYLSLTRPIPTSCVLPAGAIDCLQQREVLCALTEPQETLGMLASHPGVRGLPDLAGIFGEGWQSFIKAVGAPGPWNIPCAKGPTCLALEFWKWELGGSPSRAYEDWSPGCIPGSSRHPRGSSPGLWPGDPLQGGRQLKQSQM